MICDMMWLEFFFHENANNDSWKKTLMNLRKTIAATANIFDGKICGDFPVEFAGTSL